MRAAQFVKNRHAIQRICAMQRYVVERCLAAVAAAAAATTTVATVTAIGCIQARRRLSACGLVELPSVA